MLTYLWTEEKPRDFAGVSALEVDPLAVAEPGIGKADGSSRSRTTTDKVCGAPSYTSATCLAQDLPLPWHQSELYRPSSLLLV
jgi:hypothetical protein